MGIGENLRMLRERKRMSQEEVARRIGVGRTTYLKYESGENKPSRKLNELADFFGVTTDELLGRDAPSSQYGNLQEVQLPDKLMRVPVIGSVRCGPGGLAYEEIDGHEVVDASLGGDIRAFRCNGDSMAGDGILDGDIAIVRIQPEVENGDLAIVVVDGEEGMLKRFRQDRPDVVVLESSNPEYKPRVFVGDEINRLFVVGKVLQLSRKY